MSQRSLRRTLASVVRTLADGDRDPRWGVGKAGDAPVVLLPGFCAPMRSMVALERRIERVLGRTTIRLPLATGRLALQIDVRRSAEQADALLSRLEREHAFPYVDVVAHSLGGLVAAYWLKRIDHGRRIRRVVTLGTPHAGAPLARLGALLLGFVSRALWQMIPGSTLLRELEREPVPSGSELIAIASRDDTVVPARCARAADAPRQRSVELARVGHFDFLWSRAAFALVASALAAPLPGGMR
jgi:pimeloyl-ACP methyl ester carboxylesterase